MAPRPSSPTSLLWAHQLKREHGFLLQRMQNLEAKNKDQEARLTTTESSAAGTSETKIDELAEQVKALNESDINKRIDDMERSVAEKLDDVQAESEAHTLQIASLQKDEQMADEDRRKAMGKDKALLKRIGEVEEGLQKYEKSLDRMGKRLDETRFQQIKTQLDGLTQQIRREGEQMKWLTESIAALEAANAELTKANGKLETELSKMAAKAAAGEQKRMREKAMATNAEAETQATPGADEERPKKKKSHKWAGGGADRDIIRMGSGMIGTPSTVHKSPQTKTTNGASTKKPAPPGPKKKLQPPPPKPQRFISNDSDETPKKSHRWAGGGADKDIIQAGMSFSADRKRRRSSDIIITEAPKKKPHKPAGGGPDKDIIRTGSSPISKPQPGNSQKKTEQSKQSRKSLPIPDGDEVIVRAGKGWIEIADTQDVEPDVSTSAPPVKRKRGRPRKANITPQLTEEELAQGRVTRRGNQQTQENQPPKSDKSLVSEILGDLQYAPVVKELVAFDPSIPREKLQHLRQIMEEEPTTRTDFAALARHLDEKNQANTKKRTANSAFGSASLNAADLHTIKKIKREESPDSTTTDGVRHVPHIYSSTVSSQASNTGAQQPDRNESKDSVIGVVTSQREEGSAKPRRQITQVCDMTTTTIN